MPVCIVFDTVVRVTCELSRVGVELAVKLFVVHRSTASRRPADVHDAFGARKPLGGLAYFVPYLQRICVDAAYRGKALAPVSQRQDDGVGA